MKYKFIKKYFVANDDDIVTFNNGNTFAVGFNSSFSQKVLSKLHILGKPYIEAEGEEEEAPKPKIKIKKKKVKIDEPKAEEPTITDTESNEEES